MESGQTQARLNDRAAKAVEDWMNEIEVFSLRVERLHEDLARDPASLYVWLAEAWKLGYAARAKDVNRIP